MAFDTDEELALLRQSIDDFLADTCDYEALRHVLASDAGWRPEWWRRLAEELGVLGLAAPEDLGGLGAGPAALAVVAESFGRHLVFEPFLQSVVLAGELLRDAGPAADEVLTAIAGGGLIVAPALFEADSRYRPDRCGAVAVASGNGWRLTGRKTVVRAAPWAGKFIVSATAPDGLSLFLVDADAAGASLNPYRTFDGQRAADVVLEDVELPAEARLSPPDGAAAGVRRALDIATAIQCAQAVGVMRRMMEGSTGYLGQRRQFGQAIGGFQALRHRLADMEMALERAAAASRSCLAALDAEPALRARQASRAKLAVDQACEVVGEGAVQLHGAIGLTEELFISLAFKQTVGFQFEFGDAEFHAARSAA